MLAALANHLQLPCPMKQKRRPEADINREASRRASCPKRHCRLEEKGRGLSGSAPILFQSCSRQPVTGQDGGVSPCRACP
jgi:hypothetical protein